MENNCNKYTFDDIKKCLSNACRLSMDSSETSPATSAVLMEIGIEEIAKGIILFSKCHKPFDELVSLDEKQLSFLEELKKILKDKDLVNFDIKKLNMHSHQEKLKAVQTVINSFNSIISRGSEFIASIFLLFNSILSESIKTLFSNSKIDLSKIDNIKILKNLDVTKWDREIKENGLYVDIEKHKTPAENTFPINILKPTLFIFALILHIFVKGEETGNLKEALSFDSAFELVGCLYGKDVMEKLYKDLNAEKSK